MLEVQQTWSAITQSRPISKPRRWLGWWNSFLGTISDLDYAFWISGGAGHSRYRFMRHKRLSVANDCKYQINSACAFASDHSKLRADTIMRPSQIVAKMAIVSLIVIALSFGIVVVNGGKHLLQLFAQSKAQWSLSATFFAGKSELRSWRRSNFSVLLLHRYTLHYL